ncbi:hypothetical protein DET65_0560 [Sunxiuqinia elliptica]|uniref:Uncharacterized protein n=1 Tax=Sunxiuqinia elliptica TaxID=655355 RepID=A0A1I2E8Z2_9BACT|nr:hypothetical protein DET52_1014 [Sunxiuqinia elliptica]TDO64204.1 hypothetical protein DET65_0560 [Sunxiuqinia elliptica]SFE89066.1 hypothetical protein SAMN05216283_1024 [Sunxiuqinia elliptica]
MAKFRDPLFINQKIIKDYAMRDLLLEVEDVSFASSCNFCF